MPQRPRVTIAMQFEGHVAPTALASYTRLVHRAERDGLLGTITFCEGGVVDGARNRLVGQALQNDPTMTHLLWVDPNVVVPEDAVGRLLAGGRQVCGAVTPRRDDPQRPKAYDLEPFRWLAGAPTAPRRVGGLGLGCTMVEAGVFRAMAAHFGDEAWHKCFYGRGEDAFFFERCRALDVEVWLEPAVTCAPALPAPAGNSAQVLSVDGPASGPRVALAVPLFEAVAPPAMASLVALVRRATAAGLLQGLFFADGLFYDVARNRLVAEILASPVEFTHVLWVDSDMVVPIDALERMLAAERPVVGGLYHTKRGDLHPALFALDPLRMFEGELAGLMQVDGFGLGCALARTDVYREMAALHRDERWHVLGLEAGEDVWFFQRCKAMGVEAWLDATLQCGHVRDQAITTADWLESEGSSGGSSGEPLHVRGH